MVTSLLATTGAPAFLDNDDGDDVVGSMDFISFASPYGFVGVNPDRIAPDGLSSSSSVLRADDGRIEKRSHLTLSCVQMGTMVSMPMTGRGVVDIIALWRRLEHFSRDIVRPRSTILRVKRR